MVIRVDKVLVAIGFCKSMKEAQRKIREGAVEINGEKVREVSFEIKKD